MPRRSRRSSSRLIFRWRNRLLILIYSGVCLWDGSGLTGFSEMRMKWMTCCISILECITRLIILYLVFIGRGCSLENIGKLSVPGFVSVPYWPNIKQIYMFNSF